MTAHLTATRLRSDLFGTLDRVVATGDPVEVERPGGTVRIVRSAGSRRLDALTLHPGTVNGNADDLAEVSWEQAWDPTL